MFALGFSGKVSQATGFNCTHRNTCCLTRVEQDDRFETDKLLRFEFEHAKAGSGGQQHVEDLSHALHAVAFAPGGAEREREEISCFVLDSVCTK